MRIRSLRAYWTAGLALRAGLAIGMACMLIGEVVAAQHAAVPTVAFTCDFPGSNPSNYGLSVTLDGLASYISDGKITKDVVPDAAGAPEPPFRRDFRLSPATTSRIFELAKRAHYFEGNIDSKKKNIAATGDKTLSYRDAQKANVASYNYSPVPAVQELTALFQDLSSVVEFDRRLEYEYRYQKLALDEEMKSMENSTLQDVGPDLPAAAPMLQKILDDPSVINPVRARAQRLLQHAAGGK
ncbi:MAG: hypothetical protein ACRD3L_18070 [Terriglobales bacterium]